MRETLLRAAAYLAKTQHSDGAWSDGDPFVCARACAALLACDDQEPARETGVSYLERLQAADGRFPAKSGMYTDAACTAYALVVLNRYNYSKASLPVSRGILWLLEHQNPDGSWSGRNATKNAYTTSLCLRALYTFYLYSLAKYRLGIGHVLKRTEAPGFFDEPISHVYAPVLNLKRIGQLPQSIEARFLKYAVAHAEQAMAGGQVADVAYLAGTLSAIGEHTLQTKCVDWLRTARNKDGGYGKKKGEASDPNWTALVVLAITDRL
jgi:prenyltransferase beta subunit